MLLCKVWVTYSLLNKETWTIEVYKTESDIFYPVQYDFLEISIVGSLGLHPPFCACQDIFINIWLSSFD